MSGQSWRKSSRSENANNCVEVRGWHKSSRSANGNNCVEVSDSLETIAIRDSKLGDRSPILSVGLDQWRAFVTYCSTARAAASATSSRQG